MGSREAIRSVQYTSRVLRACSGVRALLGICAAAMASCLFYLNAVDVPLKWATWRAADTTAQENSPLGTLLSKSKQSASPQPPHILFVVADDLGWNDVGFNGNPHVKTPHLDGLAQAGVILNYSYVQPICSPTRSCLMSGRYPYRTGMQHSHVVPERGFGLDSNVSTIAQRLNRLGYSTHLVGKWHLGFCNKKYLPTQRGFDTFFGHYLGAGDYYTHKSVGFPPSALKTPLGERGQKVEALDLHRDTGNSSSTVTSDTGTYASYLYRREAIRIVKSHNASSGPLYLYLALQAPHSPLQAPASYQRLYDGTMNARRRVYSAMVSAMDDTVGEVVQAFKKRGLWKNTLTVFTTDNGGRVDLGGNNWPLRGCKSTVWEGGTRGVAFVHGQMLNKRGYTYNGLMHAVDWYPTLLSAAGRPETDKAIDGVDMWQALRNNLSSPRTEFVYNIDKTDGVFAIR
eukprot:scpid59000/ scgid0971/ Arylsulfatase B; N-acetylgalactosamine-4-sulfatase